MFIIPGIKKEEIPAELVTASGSGLDPDISPASAYVQVKRIAKVRELPEEKVKTLVDQHVDKPFLGIWAIQSKCFEIEYCIG